jgi:hypothetical protein
MTSDFVDRKAAWECNSSLKLLRFLITEDLGKLLFNEGVNGSANS